MDAATKLQKINNMRSFARALGFVTIGLLVLMFLLSFMDNSPLVALLPYYIGSGIFIFLAVSAICLLADIASELVLRRMPKGK